MNGKAALESSESASSSGSQMQQGEQEQDGLPTHIHHRSDSHGHHGQTRPTGLDASSSADSDTEEYESRTSSWHQPVHSNSGFGNLSGSKFGLISFIRMAIADFIHANQGLLLIVASQLFFAFMNVGVKFLAGLSQPVPTFEVSHRAIYK